MRTTLFRQEAIEFNRASLVGSVLAARRLPFRLVTTLAVGAALSLAALCSWGEYTRKVHVSGFLAPSTGLIKIYAGQPGTLTDKQVKEGQPVRRGDVLFVLSTDRGSPDAPQTQAAATATIRLRLASLAREHQAQLGLSRVQLEGARLRLQGMQAELQQLHTTAATQQERMQSAERALARHESLRAEGFVSSAQVEQRKDDVLDQRTRLSELQRAQAALGRDISTLQQELASAAPKEATERARTEREQAQLTQEVVESESRRAVAILAPADGVATAVLGERGQATQAQTLLLAILPADATLQAKLQVPSRAIGFLAVGDAVSLRYPAFPYQRFGTFKGRVIEIPRAMVTAHEADAPVAQSEPVYRVTVALEAQHIRTARAEVPLQSGMSLEADIWLERHRIFEWLFEPLLGLAAKV